MEIFSICVLIAPESPNCFVKNATCHGMIKEKRDVFKLSSYKNKRQNPSALVKFLNTEDNQILLLFRVIIKEKHMGRVSQSQRGQEEMKDGMQRARQILFPCERILWLGEILQDFLAKLNNPTQIKGFERQSDMIRLFQIAELTCISHVPHKANQR